MRFDQMEEIATAHARRAATARGEWSQGGACSGPDRDHVVGRSRWRGGLGRHGGPAGGCEEYGGGGSQQTHGTSCEAIVAQVGGKISPFRISRGRTALRGVET